MGRLVVHSAAEQVAAHLRAELLRGVWSGAMPGGDRLAAELGIGANTAEAALALLEKEGLLQNQGRRRGRVVMVQTGAGPVASLRVVILLGESAERGLDYICEVGHALTKMGHAVKFAPKTMLDLGMETARIQRMVAETEADAWVIFSGSSELLQWFAEGSTPAFALFGRRSGLEIAGIGPDKRAAYVAATRRLVMLGHRHIVLLARPRRRLPKPGAPEQAFLDELAAQGLPTGEYNLPSWDETVDGFHARLEALFRVTPPTALIIDEAPFYFATQQFLAQRRLRVPEDVSLVCTDYSVEFEWCRPTISYIHWESRPLIRRILKWATNVSLGKKDRRQSEIPAEFVPGGTIGKVRG